MRFILLLLLTVSSLAFGQRSQTIDADCLRIKDGTCIDKLELGYLDGATSSIQTQINSKAASSDVTTSLSGKVGTTGDESISGVKTFTGKITASSTTNGFKPCPEMTEAQRDLVATPVSGDCVFNSTSATLNIYNGSLWKSAGGGLSDWAGSFAYALGDIVISDDKIYQCIEAHTSFDFATELAAVKWLEISAGLTGIIPLSSGGTAKNITASSGAIAYSDTDSLELLAPGTSGQILQANGAAAPTFVNKSISAKSENGSSVTLEEIQVPNNQFTTTATNKHLLNDCGSSNNLLANCGFEHSTPATSWTLTNGSSAVETSNVKQGKQSLKLTLSAQALDFYQTSTLNATAFADGVNGSLGLSVKTTVDNVYLCRTDSAGAVVASTNGTSITNCLKVSNSGKWSDYPLGIILGATSNGMRLVSLTPSTAAAVAVTGDVYVDAGILEAGLKATSQGVCTTTDCTTEFSAKVSSAGVVSGENIDWINGNCAVTATSTYTCTYNSGVATISMNCSAIGDNYQISLGTQTASTFQYVTTNSGTTATAAGAQIICQKQGADFTNAKALASGRLYTASNANVGWTSYTPTFVGFGTAASVEFQWRREGDSVSIRGVFVCGTSTAVAASYTLPNSIVVKPIATNSVWMAGRWNRNPSTGSVRKGSNLVVSQSQNLVNFGNDDYTTAQSAFTAQIGSNLCSSGDVIEVEQHDIPITGWENPHSIIGSFAEVNTSPGIAKPKTCHYAFGGASATLAAPTECTTGTCVEVYDSCGTGTPPAFGGTATYSALTWAAGTFASSTPVSCTCEAWDVTSGNFRQCDKTFITGQSSWSSSATGSYVTTVTSIDNAGIINTGYIQLSCKGQAP